MLQVALSRFQIIVVLLALLATSCSLGARSPQMTSTLIVGGSHIDITVDDGKLNVRQADLIAWVQAAAESVAGYYGRFPVPHLTSRIMPFSGHGVRHGMTFGMRGGFIKIGLGSETTRAEFMNDWMLTHEMVHLAFPSVADEHHWIEEGISTYAEPIARVRAKHLDAKEMWFELVRDLHQGLPAAGDKGLDNTHTWGRTYWGGALFCFLADIEIHQKTANKKGLDDALRGILAAGGDIRQDWPLEKALDTGDHATGVSVLRAVYV